MKFSGIPTVVLGLDSYSTLIDVKEAINCENQIKSSY